MVSDPIFPSNTFAYLLCSDPPEAESRPADSTGQISLHVVLQGVYTCIRLMRVSIFIPRFVLYFDRYTTV